MIKIIPYQKTWPDEYKKIKTDLINAVGDSVLGINHIGSTSVPGLPAKDVIDIQITVKDFKTPLDKELNSIGFLSTDITCDHCPPGFKLAPNELEKRFFKKVNRPVNLHIRKIGTFNQKYPIIFRDYLRSNPMSRDAYAEVKKQLSKYFPENIDAYYDIKDPVCDLIISNAFDWCKNSNWTMTFD